MKTNKKMIAWVCSLLAALLFMPLQAHAQFITYDFTFENDGDLSAPPNFGTVQVHDNVADQLAFTITANTDVLGLNADIQAFGFMVDGVSGLSLVSAPSFFSISELDRIQGRNSDFDVVVGFGNGTPTLNPVSFIVTVSGLSLSNLLFNDINSQNNKPDANFMAHVQSTSPDDPGSEAIGGRYEEGEGGGGGGGGGQGGNQGVVPAPEVIWLLSAGLVGLAGISRRKAVSRLKA